jgi:hypothetical protein
MLGFHFWQPGVIENLEREIVEHADEDERDDARYQLAQKLADEWLLDDAERVARSIEDWPIEETWVLGEIALKLGKLGLKTRAVLLLEDCVKIARSDSDQRQLVRALVDIAKHLDALGKTEMATNLLNETIRHAETGNQLGDLLTTQNEIGQIWRRTLLVPIQDCMN